MGALDSRHVRADMDPSPAACLHSSPSPTLTMSYGRRPHTQRPSRPTQEQFNLLDDRVGGHDVRANAGGLTRDRLGHARALAGCLGRRARAAVDATDRRLSGGVRLVRHAGDHHQCRDRRAGTGTGTRRAPDRPLQALATRGPTRAPVPGSPYGASGCFCSARLSEGGHSPTSGRSGWLRS